MPSTRLVLSVVAATALLASAAIASDGDAHFINVIELIESHRKSGDDRAMVLDSNGYAVEPFFATGTFEPKPAPERPTLIYIIEGKGTFEAATGTAEYGPGELIIVPAEMTVTFTTKGRKRTEGFVVTPPAPARRAVVDTPTIDRADGPMRLSWMAIPALQLLEDGWTGPSGLVIDDFDDLSTTPRQHRVLAQTLKDQLAPIGIVATGDFTYRNANEPLELVTVRVFVFDTEASCDAWWQKKYRQPGWQNQYRDVEDVAYRAVDSLETPKRGVSIGRVWMTSHQLMPGDRHIEVLEAYIDTITRNLDAD